MVTVELEICFDNGHAICCCSQKSTRSMRRSNLPAIKFVNMINFAREFWKILE